MNFKLLKKICIVSIIGLFIINNQTYGYDISNKNQGKVVESPKVDTSIPKWFKSMETENLNTWLDILPPELQKYRNSSLFMVIPSMGLISPIVELESKNPDYRTAVKGGDFDYNKYLISGPTLYPGTAPIGKQGNSFIFAHSNYRINKPGDFKTIFRLTYNIEPGDKILFFKKDDNIRTKYVYKVTKSMLVDETDIQVMLPEKGKTEVTLSACWPIGTARQRRINRAILESKIPLDYAVNSALSTMNQNTKPTTSNTGIISGDITKNTIEYNPRKSDLNTTIAANLAIQTAELIVSQKL